MTKESIRSNWDEALSNVKHGWELGAIIEWGFTTEDLLTLCKLHESGKHRHKISNLLTECNFHSECKCINRGDYAEFRRMIIEDDDDDCIPFF